MALELVNTTASSSVQNGSSANFPLSISHKNNKYLVISITTSNRSFNTITSITFDGYSATRGVQSIGAEIWYLENPTPTKFSQTKDLQIVFSGTYDYAICCYEFAELDSPPFEASTLGAQATGNPTLPGNLIVTIGSYIIDAVAIESNTIEADNDQVEVMNLVSGGNSYGSSYKIANTTSEGMSWTRTGTPINDSWTICAASSKSKTLNQLKIINS